LVEFAGLFLLKPLMCDNVIEELPRAAVFHDQEELGLCLNDFVELDHIWMPHFLKDFDLARNALHILFVFDLVFLENLHSDLRGKGPRVRIPSLQ